jgi:uncharacterized membrane protein
MSSLSFEPLLGSWWLVALVVALLLASLLIRPQFTSLSIEKRRMLLLLRLGVIFLLLLLMLRPGVVWREQKSQSASVAVLLDYSASQQLPSGQSGLTRWKVQQEIWQKIDALRDELKGQIEIVPFSYDEQLRPITRDDRDKVLFPDQPIGRITDIGKALADLTTTQLENPLLGVVFVGDGTSTIEDAKYDPLQIARQMGQMDQPIFSLGTGPRGDSPDSRDVALEGVVEELDVFSRNRLELKGTLRLRGMVGTEVPVKVSLLDANNTASVVETLKFTPKESDEALPLSIGMIAPEAGEYRLIVEAELQNGEAITANNSSMTFVTVRSGGVHALYLEGQPRQEQLFLRRSINASPDIQLDFVIVPPSTQSRWPIDLKQSIEGKEYDAFILGDIDADALGKEQLQLLRDRVFSGAGLMLLGGFHAYDGGGYGNTPLAEILPVQVRPGMHQPFGQQVLAQLHWQGEIKMIPQGVHPVTQLGELEKNNEIWNRLAPLDGANRWLDVKKVPGVQVLAVGDKEQPLLVAASVGQGRVLASAGDSTWKWWLQGEQQSHKQFWRQSLLWVLGRDRIEQGLSVKMDQRRFYKEQKAAFRVHWQAGTGQLEMPSNVEVVVIRPDGKTIPLATTKRDAETLEGTWQIDGSAGVYKIKASTKTTGDGAAAELSSEFPFLVLDNSVELANPIPDWQLLGQLAESTKEAGGMVIDQDSIDATLRGLLKRLQTRQTEVEQARRLGDSAADQWVYLLVFAVILSAEWWLRKKWQMV